MIDVYFTQPTVNIQQLLTTIFLSTNVAAPIHNPTMHETPRYLWDGLPISETPHYLCDGLPMLETRHQQWEYHRNRVSSWKIK